MLDTTDRRKIILRVRDLVLKRHVNIGNVDLSQWSQRLDERMPSLLAAEDDGAFERGIQALLAEIKSSHTDFYRAQRNPTKPEHTIGATLRPETISGTERWMFLDIFEDGAAAQSGVRPGYLLLSVNGVPVVPPEYPTFRFGAEHHLTVQAPNETMTNDVAVTVPERKTTRPKLPFVEPKSVSYRMLTDKIGLVKIVYFSGMFGIRFSKILDAAIASLKSQGCDRLIIDLRGCIGGSLGFARLASYLCPGQTPIGYDITRKRHQQGYDVTQLPRVSMPDTRSGIIFRLAQFLIRDKSLVLLTQGLGNQPFHGHIVVLINEKTSSAGEMAAQFAKDAKLACLLGKKTAGMVAGADVFAVGSGYSLFLPVFGWFSANGNYNEGSGVVPDIDIHVDPVRLAEGKDDQLNKALEILQ
jgi:C-terminal processing protease CtpA/Prc